MNFFLNLLFTSLFLCVALAGLPVQAQTVQPKPKVISEKQADELLGSVVRVKVRSLPDARSNATLGSSREGSIGSLLVRDSEEAGTPLPGNMFVPIDLLKPILADLIDKGRVSDPPRPWLGMATEELQGRLFVTRVSPEAPADMAGVRRGDIVVGVGADAVTTHVELYRKIWSLGPAGTDVPLTLLQGASVKQIKVRSIDRTEYFRAKPTL